MHNREKITSYCVSLWYFCLYKIPSWLLIGFFCITSSVLFFAYSDFNAIVAPVTKFLVYLKTLLFNSLTSWIISAYVVLKNGLVKLLLLFGNWEVWSLKKIARHVARFTITFIARIAVFSFVINLFTAKERRGIKNMPRWFLMLIKTSPIGKIANTWLLMSDRQKRFLSGILLCIILIAFGHAFLGISILLFDVVWEILLLLKKGLSHIYRLIYPTILRFIPNAISSFFTNKIIPLITGAIPIIRDDVKVLYIRGNVRYKFREYKKNLLKSGRNARPAFRKSIRPFLPVYLREKKKQILHSTSSGNNKTE